MEGVPKNVILDLLPAYLAGEVSEESKSLVEAFAQNDQQIAEIIRSGKLESDPLYSTFDIPEDLEMKTIKRVRHSIRLKMLYVAFVTSAILIAPLIAMQFTDEVNWGIFDFIIGGGLIFGAGFTYVLITKVSTNTVYKIAVGITVAAGLLLIWINLAVGIIGSEDNPANLLYMGVLVAIVVGTGVSRLRPSGMARTLFVAALAQMFVPVVALFVWKADLELSPGLVGVLIINLFFALLFVISAFLFRNVARRQKDE